MCFSLVLVPHNCITNNAFLMFLFVGDLGGYLGLLIGASVLTIFEVLDLVCYNSMVKLTKRSRATDDSLYGPDPIRRWIKHIGLHMEYCFLKPAQPIRTDLPQMCCKLSEWTLGSSVWTSCCNRLNRYEPIYHKCVASCQSGLWEVQSELRARQYSIRLERYA